MTMTERLLNVSSPLKHCATCTCAEHDGDAYKGFELFWELYPRKVGKKESRTKWSKMTLRDKRAAYRGLKNYLAFCTNTNRILKDPLTFLNSEVWRDFQEKQVVSTTPQRPANVPPGTVYDPNTGQWML